MRPVSPAVYLYKKKNHAQSPLPSPSLPHSSAMASFIAFTVFFGFNAVLCCLQLPTMTTTTAQASQQSQSGLALVLRLAAAALVPAVLATLTLTPLLTFAHVMELARAKAAGNGGAAARLVVAGLARATLLAATAALLAGAVVQLGADGHLDRGRGDVARLNIK